MGNIDNIPNMLLKDRYTNYTKNQKSKWNKNFAPRGICYKSIR